MKTSAYNPSQLEVEMANAFCTLQREIQKFLPGNEIIDIKNETQRENPMVRFHLVDKDGDPHEIVVRIIQIPDKF